MQLLKLNDPLVLFIYLGFTALSRILHFEPIVHQRWAKTGEPGKKPPNHPSAELGFPTLDPSEKPNGLSVNSPIH